MRRFLFFFSLIIALAAGLTASGQRPFLSDYANEQLKNIPVERQDSFFLLQGKYYYAFYTRESYRRAMECYLEALRLALNYKHQDVVIKCYFGIGSVYDANNNLPQAIRYYKMNYDGVLKERPFEGANILRATYNIAATYAKAKDTQHAYDYSLKMGQMLNWIPEGPQRENYRLLIAHTFAGIGKNEEFIEYFSKIPENIDFKDGELAYGRLYAETKSNYALQTGDKDEVVPPLLKELQHTKDSIPLLNLLLKSYAALGDYKSAYECQQMLIAADMRSMDRSTYGDINYRLLEADNLLKQKQNNELKLNEESLRFNSSILYAVSLLLALGLVVTLYLYRRYRIRNNFSQHKHKLLHAYKESNTLQIKEMHHQVSDDLLALSNTTDAQLRKPDTDPDTTVRELQSKMQALALAHRMMYEQSELREIDMQHYFEQMTDTVFEIMAPPIPPVYTINMHGNTLAIDKLSALAIVIVEMIADSVRHILPGQNGNIIKLDGKLIEGEMHVTYSDSHAGLLTVQSEQETTITGTGTRTISKLARQMGAKILAEKDMSHGIRYLLIFNKN